MAPDSKTWKPPVAFHFQVEFQWEGNKASASFAEVDGLGQELVVENGKDQAGIRLPEDVRVNDLVLRRALETLGMILERETEDVLIVTHSGVLMALRCYIAGQTFEEMGIIRYKTKNAEVVEIFADDVKDAIERFQKGE